MFTSPGHSALFLSSLSSSLFLSAPAILFFRLWARLNRSVSYWSRAGHARFGGVARSKRPGVLEAAPGRWLRGGLSTGTARLADNALRVSRWRARRFRTRSPYILWRSVHLGPAPLCFATRLRTSVALTEGWVGMWPSLSPQLPQTKRPTPFCPRFFHTSTVPG